MLYIRSCCWKKNNRKDVSGHQACATHPMILPGGSGPITTCFSGSTAWKMPTHGSLAGVWHFSHLSLRWSTDHGRRWCCWITTMQAGRLWAGCYVAAREWLSIICGRRVGRSNWQVTHDDSHVLVCGLPVYFVLSLCVCKVDGNQRDSWATQSSVWTCVSSEMKFLNNESEQK